MRFLIYLVYILIAIVFVTLAVANTEVVRVTLLPEWFPLFGGFGFSAPLYLHLFLALFGGMMLGLFVEYVRESRYRRQARKAKRALKKTEKQLQKTKSEAGQHDDEVLAIVEG